MNRRLSSLAVVFGLHAAGCTLYLERAEIAEQRTVGASGLQRLQVETRNGQVEVRCVDKAAEVVVKYTKFARGRTEEDARASAASIEVEIAPDPEAAGLLRVAARIPPDLARRSAGVHFDIELPRDADVEVHTSNGLTSVEGARGSVSLKTSNGRVHVKDVDGPVEARTSNGAIVVREVRGNLILDSSNGSIEIEKAEADSMLATTSNGRISADRIAGEASFKTSNGSITLRAASLPAHPMIKASTSNGSVLVEVPSSVQARLLLKTSNGGIDQRLEGVAVSNLEASRKRVSAVLNGGGGDIEVETSNGRITFQTVP